MPFDDLTGNSGFTSNSEGAEANLDINMSEDSARNLWDVQAAIQQIATDFQTAVRAASDFNSYLISIRETSQTVKMPSLGLEGGEGGNMSYAGGRVDSGSVPGGLAASEISQAQRIGEMEENASGMGGGAMSARNPGRGMEAGEFVSQMTNAAWMASMTGRADIPQETTSAYEQNYRWALRNMKNSQVRNAQFAGQSGTARAFAAQRLISNALPGARQFLAGGGAGGAAAMLGRLGTYGAIGYAGYELVDAGVQNYVQSRSMAISANNGLGPGWGFDQRLSQSIMAMSPFITGDEAAQIYSTAIQQGWASRDLAHGGPYESGDFGQAVNFMYGAAKDYNMDPAQSAQLLQTNALGAGESVQALAEQLATLKQVVTGTGMSMESASASFTNFTSFLIASGATPGTAAQIAGGAIGGYAGNAYLGPTGRGSEIVMQTLQQQQTQNVLAGLTGTLPGASLAGNHAVQSTAELQKLTARFANQVLNMKNLDPSEQAAMFQQLYNGTFGTSITPQDASNMMAENAANPQLLSKAQQDYLDKGKLGKLEHRNWFASWWNSLDDTSNIGAIGGNSRVGGTDAAMLAEQEKNSALINSYSNYNSQVNTLLENSGDNLGNVILYGPDGQPVQMNGNRVAGANIAKWFNDPNNYNKFADAKGGYYIQDQSGNKYNANNIGYGGSVASSDSDTSGNKNVVTIQLSAEAKRYFATDKSQVNLSTGKTTSGG